MFKKSPLLYFSTNEALKVSSTPPGRLKISNTIQFLSKSLNAQSSETGQRKQKKSFIFIPGFLKTIYEPSTDQDSICLIRLKTDYKTAQGAILRMLFVEGFDIYVASQIDGEITLLPPTHFENIFINTLKNHQLNDGQTLYDVYLKNPKVIGDSEILNIDEHVGVQSFDKDFCEALEVVANHVFELAKNEEFASINQKMILAEAKNQYNLVASKVLIFDYFKFANVYQNLIEDNLIYKINYRINMRSTNSSVVFDGSLNVLMQGILRLDKSALFSLHIHNQAKYLLNYNGPQKNVIELKTLNIVPSNLSYFLNKDNGANINIAFKGLSKSDGLSIIEKHQQLLLESTKPIYAQVVVKSRSSSAGYRGDIISIFKCLKTIDFEKFSHILLTTNREKICYKGGIDKASFDLFNKNAFYIGDFGPSLSLVFYQETQEKQSLNELCIIHSIKSQNEIVKFLLCIKALKGHENLSKIYILESISSDVLSYFIKMFPQFEFYDREGKLYTIDIASNLQRYKPIAIDFQTALRTTQAMKIFTVEDALGFKNINEALLTNPRNYIQVSPNENLTRADRPPRYAQAGITLGGKEEIYLDTSKTRATLTALSAFDELIDLQLTIRTPDQTYILEEQLYQKNFCEEFNCWWIELNEPVDEQARVFAKHRIKVQSPDAAQITNCDHVSSEYPEETNDLFIQNFIQGQDVPESDQPHLFWRFLEYVRTFEMKAFTSSSSFSNDNEKLMALTLGKRGVCRHSLLVFKYLVELAQQKGIDIQPIKYKQNDCHTFILTQVPQENGELRWQKVDVVSRKTAGLDTTNALQLIDNTKSFDELTAIRLKEHELESPAGPSDRNEETKVSEDYPTLQETMNVLCVKHQQLGHAAHLLEHIEDIEPYIIKLLNHDDEKVFIINSPDDLQSLTKQFHVTPEGDIQKTEDSPLRYFAENIASGKLIINLSYFTAKQIRQINGLFDDLRQICGVRIPSSINIICVMTKEQYQGLGQDFKRRVKKAPLIMDIASEKASVSPTSMCLEETFEIDVMQDEQILQQKLEGRFLMTEQGPVHEAGAFHDSDKLQFNHWSDSLSLSPSAQLLREGIYFSNGIRHQLAQQPIFNEQQINLSDLTVENIQLKAYTEMRTTLSNAIIVNQYHFSSLFAHHIMDEHGTWLSSDGWLSHASEEKPLLVTTELTQRQWYQLLTAIMNDMLPINDIYFCKQANIPKPLKSIIDVSDHSQDSLKHATQSIDPNINLQTERLTSKEKGELDLDTLNHPFVIIHSDNLMQSAIALSSEHHMIVPVDQQSFVDDLVRVVKRAEDGAYVQEKTDVWRQLENGNTVFVVGKINTAYFEQLVGLASEKPYIISQDVCYELPQNARLILITDTSVLPNHEILDSFQTQHHLTPPQSNINSDLMTEKFESAEVYGEQRLNTVLAACVHHAVITLEGEAGTGKTSFVLNDLLSHLNSLFGNISLCFGEEKIAAFCDAIIHEVPALWVIDEANMVDEDTMRQLSTLMLDNPGIYYQGRWYALNKELHQVILLGNPGYYQSRMEHEVYEHHKILFPKIPSCYIDYMMAPIKSLLQEHHLSYPEWQQSDYALNPRKLARQLLTPLIDLRSKELFEQAYNQLKSSKSYCFLDSRIQVVKGICDSIAIRSIMIDYADRIFPIGIGGICVEGETIAGKTTLIIETLKALNVEYKLLSASLDEDVLEQELEATVKEGYVPVLDELNGFDIERALNALSCGIDFNGHKLPYPMTLFCSQNPSAAYPGTKPLSPALLSRLESYTLSKYTKKELQQIYRFKNPSDNIVELSLFSRKRKLPTDSQEKHVKPEREVKKQKNLSVMSVN